MKKIFFLFFCLLTFGLYGQEKEKDILVSDTFLDITFLKDKIDITEKGLKILNYIGSNFSVIDKSKFELYFEVVPNEEEKIDLIEYKRVLIVLNYLRDNYQIDKSIFRVIFHEAITNNNFIRFSLSKK